MVGALYSRVGIREETHTAGKAFKDYLAPSWSRAHHHIFKFVRRYAMKQRCEGRPMLAKSVYAILVANTASCQETSNKADALGRITYSYQSPCHLLYPVTDTDYFQKPLSNQFKATLPIWCVQEGAKRELRENSTTTALLP